MTRQSLRYGDEDIRYKVSFLSTIASKVAIHVHPDGSVQVDAPSGTSLPDVKEAVRKRARWVSRHLKKIADQQCHVLPRRYVSGESHFYLGRRYQLKVINAKSSNQGVKLLRGRLQVKTADRSPDCVRWLLSEWYRNRAADVCQRRIEALVPQVTWLKGKVPPISMRVMKRQWGSCSPKGNVLLNPHLVKAPRDCVDYVLLHELCHLQEHNHSPRFYRLLGKLMPDWEVHKSRLDFMAEHILNQ